MTNEPVIAAQLAPPIGPFSPAIVASGTRILALSGQVADTGDGTMVVDDAGDQARKCLANIDALLRAAGATKSDVVRLTVFLTHMSDRAVVAKARTEYFGEHKPAATLVEVSALVAPEYKVEIEATAIF
jgi:enamine deaminase RidA (YjgF/YER057c/UK114 family)